MNDKDRPVSQILLSYCEGEVVGCIHASDVSIAGVCDEEEGGEYQLEIWPNNQVRLTASEGLMKSMKTGYLSYFLDEKKWDGRPPLRAYLLVRI